MDEKKKRILVLEDDPRSLLLVSSVLTGAGFAVDSRRTGLFIFESDYVIPDLFVIEKDLPVVDGIAISKFLRLQRVTRTIPIVLVSINSLEEQATQLDLTQFLQKPLDLSHFLKVVYSLVFRVHLLPNLEINDK